MRQLQITIIILVAGSLLFCSKVKEIAKIKINKNSSGIVLIPNTSLRIEPLVFSTRIAQMKKGDSVQIIDKSKTKRAIGKYINYWYKVKSKEGFVGWIYGNNLKIISSRNKSSMKRYIKKFWEKESEKLKKALTGKWWSINKFNDFTNHCLELYLDGKYRSYWKGYEHGAIKGTYSFDFEKNEIKFDKNTTFKNTVHFIRMGQEYILRKELKDKEMKFKKIKRELPGQERFKLPKIPGITKKKKSSSNTSVKKKKDGNKTK